MQECIVSFSTVEEVRNFVTIATKQFFNIQVEQGDLRTSGMSIMSLFSMGLNRPMKVLFPQDAETEPFLRAVSPYLVA